MFESEFAKCEYIEKDNVVFHVWKKEAHFDDYRQPVMASLEMLREHRDSVFIVDARNGFEDVKEDVEWGFEWFLPELKKTGCRTWGFILPEVSEIEGEIDLWTKEIEKNFRVIRAESYEEIVWTMYAVSHTITAEEYIRLRECVGWSAFAMEQAEEGLKNSYNVVIRQNGHAVALARAIMDHGYVVFIADVIVEPEHQGQGLGRMLVENIVDHVKNSLKPGYKYMISLLAAKGKEGFYSKLGFVERPNETFGCGFHQWFSM